MGEQNQSIGDGILKGLKNLLFQSEQETINTSIPDAKKVVVMVHHEEGSGKPTGTSKEMKLRIYQLLESMNNPGVDFFEVWNAATEMGGANTSNIKAAFTSLKFADKSLNKEKLMASGRGYINGLKSVLENESAKRMEEKKILEQQKEQVRSSLANEISQLEQQIVSLQQKLEARKTEITGLQEKYEPQIREIEEKIEMGQGSVNSVLNEMQQVLDLINKEIN
jgi:hypothetical protein